MMIEDNKENEDHAPERGRTAIIFSLKNEVGGLVKALKLFQVCNNSICVADLLFVCYFKSRLGTQWN